MKYHIDIYKNNPENTARFALGTTGKNPLFVIGLNPSTADDKKPDMTITKIRIFAKNAHFDGFVMLNLYAQRTPFPNQLDTELNSTLHQENVKHILQCFKVYKQCSILASWGATINTRPFLPQCLTEIKIALDQLNVSWLKIGDLTQGGHPRHPSRAAYKQGLTRFNVDAYVKDHAV
jgi:hypothetical protein